MPHHLHQILMESFHAVLQQNKMYFKEPKATLDIIIPETRNYSILESERKEIKQIK